MKMSSVLKSLLYNIYCTNEHALKFSTLSMHNENKQFEMILISQTNVPQRI